MSKTLAQMEIEQEIKEAIAPINGGKDLDMAIDLHAALRSAVRAVLPGRQQKKNLEPSMNLARRAFIRTLKRRSNRATVRREKVPSAGYLGGGV